MMPEPEDDEDEDNEKAFWAYCRCGAHFRFDPSVYFGEPTCPKCWQEDGED
jgi:hypothetical protein